MNRGEQAREKRKGGGEERERREEIWRGERERTCNRLYVVVGLQEVISVRRVVLRLLLRGWDAVRRPDDRRRDGQSRGALCIRTTRLVAHPPLGAELYDRRR